MSVSNLSPITTHSAAVTLAFFIKYKNNLSSGFVVFNSDGKTINLNRLYKLTFFSNSREKFE
jgi:hypothetical protein